MNSTTLRVLLVEDEQTLTRLISDGLVAQGCEVDSVFDGEAAIQKLSGAYDIILLDLLIPKKDGFMVLEEAKKLEIATPIVVITNLNESGELERAKSLGAVETIVKANIDLNDFVQLVLATIKKFKAM